MNFNESTIPMIYAQKMGEADLDWDANWTRKIYEVVVTGISDFLALAKSKNNKVAVAVRDLKGNFLMGAIVEYHSNENEDMPGNWSYEFSFDEKDLEGATVYLTTDTQFQKQLSATAYNLHRIQFEMEIHIETIIELCVSILKQWLDMNAKEAEEVNIELIGYFVASVAIENGEKVIAIIPDGAMKRLIKDDAALEE